LNNKLVGDSDEHLNQSKAKTCNGRRHGFQISTTSLFVIMTVESGYSVKTGALSPQQKIIIIIAL